MAEASPIVVGPDMSGTSWLVVGATMTELRGYPPDDAQWLDARDAQLMLGHVNAHTHMYSGLAPLGLPPPQPPPQRFIQILERVWWRLDRALDRDALRASARLYIAEALLAGTTTLIDHHESPSLIEGSLDVLGQACHELGIRAMLGYGATERNGGLGEGRRGLAESRRWIEKASPDGRVRGAIALHASFTASDTTIREAAAMCRDLSAILHIHVAEDGVHRIDALDANARGYAGPLERLLDLEALVPGSILAHGLDLDAQQVRRACDAGAWIVQNPRSNRGNAVGYPRALSHSDRVALGTDGYPARMDEEAAALRAHAQEHAEDPIVVESRVRAGHRLASECFGGAFIRPTEDTAAVADLCVTDGQGTVRHVVVDGRIVVCDGELVGADIETIRAEASEQAHALWARMHAMPPA